MGRSTNEVREPLRLTFQNGGEAQDTILRRIVTNLLAEMGVTGVSQEDIENAVSSYMANHPIDSVTDEEISQLIGEYMSKNPIETINSTDVKNAVTAAVGTQLDNIETLLQNIGTGETVSPYTVEGLDVPPIPNEPIIEVSDDFKGTSAKDTTLSNMPSLTALYELFYDKYVGANLTDYSVTKKSLGKDQSGVYELYEYDFCPSNWERMILLSSGMHTYEVSAILGLGYFISAMMDNHVSDTFLDYLYRKVRIKIIPIVNPWGYSQSPKKYGNVNGVNPNRNFDFDGIWEEFPVYSANPNDSNYNEWNVKGSAPFSEAETQILREWIETNLGAEFWIDCHTGLGIADKELFSVQLSTSPYYAKINDAHARLEEWTKSYYNLNSINTKYDTDLQASIKLKWCEGKYHLPMMVIEQCMPCESLGITNNGDRNSIINYTFLLYAYLGQFLAKNQLTLDGSSIKELIQKSISERVFHEPTVIEVQPIPIDIKQGGISSENGQITESDTRLYFEVPALFDSFVTVSNIANDNNVEYAARAYNSNDDFVSKVGTYTNEGNIYFYSPSVEVVNKWVRSDGQIRYNNEMTTPFKLAFVIKNLSNTQITPSDMDGTEIVINGVTYVLKA